MMTNDSLKSAISLGNVDDTSLALPSANQYISGQQRVRDQVQTTIRRTKSRKSIAGPLYDSAVTDAIKTLPATFNGHGNGLSKTLSMERNANRRFSNNSKGSTLKKSVVISDQRYDRGFVSLGAAAASNTYTSRSEPDLACFPRQRRAATSRRPSGIQKEMGTSLYLLNGPRMSTTEYLSSGPRKSMVEYLSNGPRMSTTEYLSSGPRKSTSQYLSNGPRMSTTEYLSSGPRKSTSQYLSNGPRMSTTEYLSSGPRKSTSQYLSNGPRIEYLSSGPRKSTSQYLSNGQQMSTTEYLSSGPRKSTSQYLSNGPRMSTTEHLTSDQQVIKNGTSQTVTTTHSQMYQTPSTHTIDGSPPKSKEDSGSDIADITMSEAVEYLSSDDEVYQHCGASFVQHSTYMDDQAKREVSSLNGIPPLVSLLRSPSGKVQQTASAALRNLSFKDTANKEGVGDCNGITEAARLLRETHSADTQKQLTGLLWNLSSVDNLKPDLVKSAVPVLMESVILPYTTGPERTEHEVFFNATGCLRNLSSAKQSNRQAMRKCRGLIDSLVRYAQDCVAADRPDDKSLENCVCVLHNLTFQLEAEAPVLFTRVTTLARAAAKPTAQGDTGPIGCFSQRTTKTSELDCQFDYPVIEEQHPRGAGWLFHSQTLQTYLSLLGCSQMDDTLEACCGALQNLTTHQGIVSGVMSQTIVQKLNGLTIITPLLKSPRPNLQRSAVALVGNLAKNQRLHTGLARKTLPDLVDIICLGTKKGNESDDTLAIACQTAHCVLIKEPELGKRLLSNTLITSLTDLSHNKYFPKSSKAASLFLYHLWVDKDLQCFLKKQGLHKALFVNDITAAAHKSVQVVE